MHYESLIHPGGALDAPAIRVWRPNTDSPARITEDIKTLLLQETGTGFSHMSKGDQATIKRTYCPGLIPDRPADCQCRSVAQLRADVPEVAPDGYRGNLARESKCSFAMRGL